MTELCWYSTAISTLSVSGHCQSGFCEEEDNHQSSDHTGAVPADKTYLSPVGGINGEVPQNSRQPCYQSRLDWIVPTGEWTMKKEGRKRVTLLIWEISIR